MRPTWSSRGLSEEARVNVTPLIDVVMCLIVFYLMVGHLVIQRRGETDLPSTAIGVTVSRETDPLAITILVGGAFEPGTVLIDGVEIPGDRVSSVISGRLAREPGLSLQVRADKQTAYSQIQPVLDACRDAGAKAVELATRQSALPGGTR